MRQNVKGWQKGLNRYFTDIQWSNNYLYVLIFTPILGLCFKSIFIQLTNDLVTNYISKVPKNNPLLDLLLVLLFIVSILDFLFFKLRKGLFPPLFQILTIFWIYSSIVLPFKLDGNYQFYKIQYIYSRFGVSVFYLDILVFFSCIKLIGYKTYYRHPVRKSNEFSLVEDSLDYEKQEDQFNREEYATEIIKIINGTYSKTALSIGVFSEWGSGKTDFLKRLKRAVESPENKSSEHLIIEFNPWKTNSRSLMIEDFFTLFSKKLEPFNSQIDKKIKTYSRKIFQTSQYEVFRFFDSFLNGFQNENSQSEDLKGINNIIIETGKKIIILIDDSDRLSGKEILDVLKLIRNTADFSNTFFITTIDYKYVTSSISFTNELVEANEYLKKIFQLVITLPVLRKEKFIDIFRELFCKDFDDLSERRKIDNVINSLEYQESITHDENPNREGLFEKLLQNPRDLRIFYNSFKLSYRLVGKEVELKDLILLELIKVSSFEIYQSLSKKYFLKIDEKGDFMFNESEFEEFKIVGINPNVKTNISLAINKILNRYSEVSLAESKDKGLGRFSNPINFYLYFTFVLPENIISRNEFYMSLDGEKEDFKEKIKNWDQLKARDLKNVLFNYQPEDFLKFKKIIEAMLHISDKKNGYFEWVESILTNYPAFQNKYIISENMVYNFIRELVYDDSFDLFTRARIANSFLMKHLYKTNFKLGEKDFWQNQVFELFDEYLDSKNVSYWDTLNFYHLNNEYFGGTRMGVSKRASQRYREFLAKEENFIEYLKFMFRSYTVPNYGHFIIEDFFNEYFLNINEFRERLKRTDVDEDLLQLKDFILRQDDKIYSSVEAERILSLHKKEDEEDYNFIYSYLKGIGSIPFDDPGHKGPL